jgi:hypothetical protein
LFGVADCGEVDPNDYDRFVLRQKWHLVLNEYEFSLPDATGAPARPFCYVRQKMFKFKEDVRFYSDSTLSVETMRIKARQRFDPRARYDVVASDGSKIGEVQKVFGASLLRSTYRLYNAVGAEVATAGERNMIIALIRRIVGLVPYIENVAAWLPIPYDFVFERDGIQLGSHRRQLWKVRDVYTIDLTGDPGRILDRRLVLATAVAMDAFQAR